MQRRTFIQSIAAGAVSLSAPIALDARTFISPNERFASIEKHSGGRLGVFALDSGSHRRVAYRIDEHFPMCSTFKFLAVSAVLARVDKGEEHLDRRIAYGKRDLLEYAPVTSARVRDGSMSVDALCAAAIELSDNTAANLLLASFGGPPAVTRYARSLGDPITRLDRNEPSLNTAIPDDPRDTTTPRAMLADMQAVLLGDALSAGSRNRLDAWLQATKTGLTSIRAGIPPSWMAGDKTGTGENGTHNDIAILWPPNRKPILVASFLTGASASSDAQDAALADVGRIVSQTFA